MALLSGFGKRGVELNLLTKPADILDTEFLSKYFVLQEFEPKLTAGKNSITFNGSELLKEGTEVLVECIDSDGNPLYIESTTKTNIAYKEASSYILSIHVYNEVANGPGKLVLYGTTLNGATVKWVGNVVIDKTLQNSSTVRFYEKPVLEVVPVLSPILNNASDFNKSVVLTGSFYSYAVSPQKDSLDINKKNVDIDYRIYFKNLNPDFDPSGSFNSQLPGTPININIRTIQEPFSYKNIKVDVTSSFVIKNVLNRSTLTLNDAISYKDSQGNDVIVNVVDGDFSVSYPFVIYNTASEASSYLRANTGAGSKVMKQSYANVVYKNLRTFSGFISRHKVYKKSLFAPGDFTIVADEPLIPYQLLQDKLTTNKTFDQMGSFYNKSHINRYWFSSGDLQLTHSSDIILDGMYLNYTGSCSDLDSTKNYAIVKDNTSNIDRNSTYFPYDSTEFVYTSGSSYDSNFIELKKGVNYLISFNSILKRDESTKASLDVGLEFYFTSSLPQVSLQEGSLASQKGLFKIGFAPAFGSELEKVYTPYNILFSVLNDLQGTLVVVPRKCRAIISNLSLKPYGDYGFSPDTLITRIPFPVIIANEAFEIKAELFDINSNLVFSDLRTITAFDPSGSSLSVFIPGYQDPAKTEFISGSLEISQSLIVGENTTLKGSLTVGGTVKFENIEESTYTTERMLAWHPVTNKVVFTNVNNVYNVGTEYVRLDLYDRLSSSPSKPYRVIPSVEGRNISVLMPTPGLLLPPSPSNSQTEISLL